MINEMRANSFALGHPNQFFVGYRNWFQTLKQNF